LPHALSHSPNADAKLAAAAVQFSQNFVRYTFAGISDLQLHGPRMQSNANARCLTSRVTENVRQAFLDDSKECSFHDFGKPSRAKRYLQVYFHFAPLSKAVD